MMDCQNIIKRKKARIWRAVVFILFLCMTVIVSDKMPVGTVQAAESGDYRYEVNDDGTTVTITRYIGSATTIIIPSTLDGKTVTSIGKDVFRDCSGLTSIGIQSGVTSIGEAAFWGCSGLTNIEIPGSVTSIGNWAFWGCSGLTSIEIPSDVTSIQSRVFKDCSGLTSMEISDGVTSIGWSAFEGCSGLTSIEIPGSVTSIGMDAFNGCSDTMIIYADTPSYAATYAAENGFTVEPIENFTPPTTGDKDTEPGTPGTPATGDKDTKPVTTLGTPATGDKDTKPVTTPTTPAASGTVLTVSDSQCKVTVNSGNAANPTVTFIGTTKKKATAVTVPATVTVDGITYKVTGIADNAFKNNKMITKVTIGADITTIGKQAFYNCVNLKKITIPAKVTSIGKQTFYGCKNLKNITIKTTKLTDKKIGSKAFKGIHAKATIKVPKKKLADYKKILKKKGVSSKVKIKK